MNLKLFIASILLCLSGITSAADEQIDTRDLSQAQIAEIKKQVSTMKAETNTPVNISKTVRGEAEAWGDLGANMGKAMVGAAKEVGVAANDFASTSLGKIVVFIIAYKIIGKSILGVIIGSLIFNVGTTLSIWFFRSSRWSKVKYTKEPAFWGLYQRQIVVEKDTDSDTVGWQFFFGTIMLVLSWGISIILIL